MQNSKLNTGTDLMAKDSAGNPVIEHYNPVTGFSIIMDTGNGVAGKNIPHSQQKLPAFFVKKSLIGALTNWISYNKISGSTKYLKLDEATTETTSILHWNDTEPTDSNLTVGTNIGTNADTVQYITYLQCDTENNVVKGYDGTGQIGNEVNLGLDMTVAGAYVMIKSLTSAYGWVTFDKLRVSGDNKGYLFANTSAAEILSSVWLDFTSTGITLRSIDQSMNTAGVTYLIQAYSPVYKNPTDGNKIGVNSGKKLTYTQGIGLTNIEETTTATEVNCSAFAGDTAYILKERGSNAISFGQGVGVGQSRQDADRFGVDNGLFKTTDKHTSHSSATGFASASSEYSNGAYSPFEAFDKLSNENNSWISNETLAEEGQWLMYETIEPRELNNVRFQSRNSLSFDYPKTFTIQCSNNGVTWDTFHDQTVDVVLAQAEWTQAYTKTGIASGKYTMFRLLINTKFDTGTLTYVAIGELEFNFEISDQPYLNTLDKLVYNGSDVATEYLALGEVKVDTQGNTYELTEYNPLISYMNDLIVNDIKARRLSSRNICTAWVRFNGQTIPPTIYDSFNVSDVIKIGTGDYEVHFETPMDDTGYVPTASGISNTGTNNNVVQGAFPSSRNYSRVTSHFGGSGLFDRDNISLQIIGGKN